MAKSNFNISLKLLTDNFNKGIRSVQKQLQGFGRFVKGAFALGSITAFGRQMVSVGKDFEDAMARVKAVSNASQKDFQAMQREAQRLGETTKYTASEAAAALENLTRNGMSARQATESLSGVLQLAGANAIGLAEAADIVTNTMNMFGLSTKDVTKINDILSVTAATTATNISLLYEALVNAAPAAHTLGFSLEETSAAIGALAQRGVKGADAGTQLRMALTKMADPKIIAKMQEMGVAIDAETMKSDGLLGTIKKLKDAHLDLTDLVSIFSQRGAVGMQQLINSYDDFALELEITKAAEGTTQRMFQQGIGTTKKAIDTLKSTYEGFLISLSQKTSGVVNGVIRLLTNLINNFKTVGGTITNIAAVAMPLILKGIHSIQRAYVAAGRKIVATSVAIKAAVGGWVDLIITAIAWVGTALVGAWNKAHQAIKDANQEINNTNKTIARNEGVVDSLIGKLKTDGKNSLVSVVAEACELFPDFAEEIKKAATEASKTGEYDKLITKLNEINNLQTKMLSNAAARKMFDAQISAGAYKMRKASKNDKKKAGLQDLQDYFDKNKIAKDLQETIYGAILEMRVNSMSDKDISGYVDSVTGGEVKSVNFNHNMIDELFKNVGEARDIKSKIEANQEEINAHDAAVKAEQERIKAEEEAALKAAEIAEQEATTKKESADKIAKIEEKLQNSIEDVKDDLSNGVIDADQALKDLTSAFKTAYEEFRSADRNAENPYKEKYVGLSKGETTLRGALGLSTTQPLPVIDKEVADKLKGQATTQQNTGLARPTSTGGQISVGSPFSQMGFIDQFSTATDAAGQVVGAISNIKYALDALNDPDADWITKLSAGISILQTLSGAMELVTSLSKLFGIQMGAEAVDTVAAKGLETTATLEAAEAEVVANTAVAGAGAAASQAAIPIIGPVLAAGAVGMILGLLASSLPKFAEGGIVGGSSLHGDNNIVRVNSGEMILNKREQASLFNALKNGVGTEGKNEVNFVIRGKDLVGAITNYEKATGKIKSSL